MLLCRSVQYACPIGLAIFGISLQSRLNLGVLALGAFLVSFSANGAVPMTINYLVETFASNPQEVGTAMNVWRLILGLSIPFFIEKWEHDVAIGWVFGTAAFLNLFATSLVLLLMWKGPSIRQWHLMRVLERYGKG